MLLKHSHFDIDLTDGESNVTSARIETGEATDLSLWAVPVTDDPSTAVARAYATISPDVPADARTRLTAAGTIDLTGASVLDLDVSKRSDVFIKVVTAEANRAVTLYYALRDNRSV